MARGSDDVHVGLELWNLPFLSGPVLRLSGVQVRDSVAVGSFVELPLPPVTSSLLRADPGESTVLCMPDSGTISCVFILLYMSEEVFWATG